jgi:hypothetical protein
MQTGDAELEMRGRCSAGQKVKYSVFTNFNCAAYVMWSYFNQKGLLNISEANRARS